jgi:hypothetical protein
LLAKTKQTLQEQTNQIEVQEQTKQIEVQSKPSKYKRRDEADADRIGDVKAACFDEYVD